MKRLIALAILMTMGCGSDDSDRKDGFWTTDLLPSRDRFSTGCAPGQCTGCCMGTACLEGKSAAACGFGGNPCQTCPTGTCLNGSCQGTPCSATSCATGCCDSLGACQQVSSATACGVGGASCKKCDTEQECTNGSCIPKGSANYKVTLVSAMMPAECGSYDNCDTFIILTVGSSQITSSTKDDTATPVWNELLLTASQADLLKSFSVQVFDNDYVSNDDMGQCSPKITTTNLSSGKLVTNCGNVVKDLTFEFKPAN
jgi:hypothetical protein